MTLPKIKEVQNRLSFMKKVPANTTSDGYVAPIENYC